MRDLKITQQITNRNNDSLNKYLNEVARFQMIGIQDEIKLCQMIKKGDKVAEEKLVKANLRFVISCAKQYQRSGIPLADLINEGNIGLMKAARLYDESKGFKFISYAVWWIRQSILASINEYIRAIRLPVNQIGNVKKVKNARNMLEIREGREVFPAEIADELGISEEEVVKIDGFSRGLKLLDDFLPGTPDTDRTLIDSVPSPDIDLTVKWYSESSLHIQLKRVLGQLPPRDRDILIYTYGLFGCAQMDSHDIAERFGVSQERIRQITKSAIEKVKSYKRMLIEYV